MIKKSDNVVIEDEQNNSKTTKEETEATSESKDECFKKGEIKVYEDIINDLKNSIEGEDALFCAYQTGDYGAASCLKGSYVMCAEALREFLEFLFKDKDDDTVAFSNMEVINLIYDDKCRREGISIDKLSHDMLNEWIAEDSTNALREFMCEDKCSREGMELDNDLTAEDSPLDQYYIDASQIFIENEITDCDKFIEDFSESVENEDYFHVIVGTVTKDDETRFFSSVNGDFGLIKDCLLAFIQAMLTIADDNVAKYLRGIIVDKVMSITYKRNYCE